MSGDALEIRADLYGPRLKLMANAEGSEFVLLLDEFDEEKKTSTVVVITVPRAQLDEWVATFAKALGS